MSDENPYTERDCDSLSDEPTQSPQIKKETKAENPPNPPFIPTAEHRPENDKNPKEKWKDLTKWGKFERIFKVIEFLGIFGGIFFIGFQGCELRKATGAAVAQSIILQVQLDEMKNTRELDERAWVTAYDFKPNDIDTLNYFKVVYKNTGKTPAINSDFFIRTETNFKNIPARDTKPNPPKSSELLAPNGTGIIDTTNIPIMEGFNIESGTEKTFYIYGTIWYDDIFNHHHWSQFCVHVIGRGRPDNCEFEAMPIHNSCDDAQTNQPN